MNTEWAGTGRFAHSNNSMECVQCLNEKSVCRNRAASLFVSPIWVTPWSVGYFNEHTVCRNKAAHSPTWVSFESVHVRAFSMQEEGCLFKRLVCWWIRTSCNGKITSEWASTMQKLITIVSPLSPSHWDRKGHLCRNGRGGWLKKTLIIICARL